MQEALIKTYRYVGRIREPEAFRPWLYRTVRNACLMGRRKRVGRTDASAVARRSAARTRRPDASGRTASRKESGTAGGQRRASSPAAKGAPLVTRSLPSHRLPAGDGRPVDARGGEGNGHDRGQRQNALASGSYPTPEGSGEQRRMTLPARPSAALSRPGPGVVALSGWRPDSRPPSDRRRAHQGVCVLWDDGRTSEENDGRVPRRGEAAAAPRRDVARGEADPRADHARGPSAQHLRRTSTQTWVPRGSTTAPTGGKTRVWQMPESRRDRPHLSRRCARVTRSPRWNRGASHPGHGAAGGVKGFTSRLRDRPAASSRTAVTPSPGPISTEG